MSSYISVCHVFMVHLFCVNVRCDILFGWDFKQTYKLIKALQLKNI